MIACLQKVDPVIPYKIDDSMLLCESARPGTVQEMTEGLRLADPLERVAHDRFDDLQSSERSLPVPPHPPSQILPELLLEDSEPFSPDLLPTRSLTDHRSLSGKLQVIAQLFERDLFPLIPDGPLEGGKESGSVL